jgi:hypothetical protein
MCSDIPSYVSEQCVHCAAIKEEIVFLKNEIRRSCTTYGIEVAETLETNPLFSETIEKLVLRIEILEQVLLRQLIDTETAARNGQQQDDVDDVPDDVSELSEEPAVDEHASESETDEDETEPNEEEDTAKEEGEVTEESYQEDQEENEDEDETQVQYVTDDMDISTEDPCNNITNAIKMAKGLLLKHIDFNKISRPPMVRQHIENSDARKFNYDPFAEIDATLHLNNDCPLSFNNEFAIFGDHYTYFDDASSHIHVTIPTPQPDHDTDTNDDEVASITRGIEQMNHADTMRSPERSSNEVDSVNSERENRKRPRPESPELWLYDGSMV